MDAGDPERLLDPRGRLDLGRIALAHRQTESAMAANDLVPTAHD